MTDYETQAERIGQAWFTGGKAKAAEVLREVVGAQWQPIETAPKNGTPIIGAYFNQPWSDSHMNGQIVQCWWQPEFGAFISSCREMSLATGLTFEGGSSRQLHSPVYERVSHWMPLPPTPAQEG